MGKALAQLWAALTTLFAAFEVLARAVMHLCEWSEATAGAFKDEAADDRAAKQAERKAAMGITSSEKPKAVKAA